VLAVFGMLGVAAPACAAGFPQHAITLVVPYPAGGATDTLGRILARGLARRLGQEVVTENKGGAGTVIGATSVAQAPPDGYTLLISTNSTFTLNPAVRADLRYDPIRSFESLGTVGSSPLVLLANPAVPVRTLADVINLAKARPGTLSYASFGIGTSPHFAGEMLKVMAAVDIVHVPYKGEGPALQDLIAGQVPLAFDTNIAALPQLRAGKVRAIAVTSSLPTASLPGVPSIAQSGYPDYEMVPWYALVAPRGLSEPVRRVLTKALKDTLADAQVRDALQQIGIDVGYQPPSAYEARVGKELPLMRAYAHKARIQLD
jgi:tripartite-type tricarboxylate transporter receptor subunit TctC